MAVAGCKSKIEVLPEKYKGLFLRRHPKGVIGRPDFGNKARKIAVFIDGCFWHKCPIHSRIVKTGNSKWISIIDRNAERDKKTSELLMAKGWQVVRIWEHGLIYSPTARGKCPDCGESIDYRAKRCRSCANRNRMTPELRERLADAVISRSVSEETRRKMSLSSKGKPKSKEHRKKLSLALKGRTYEQLGRLKLAERIRRGEVSEDVRGRLSECQIGEKNHSWKGGRKMAKGYVTLLMPAHPRAWSSGYVYEHIVVLEEKLNRRLGNDECTHHINGIKYDNRSENLEATKLGEHSIYHNKKRHSADALKPYQFQRGKRNVQLSCVY